MLMLGVHEGIAKATGKQAKVATKIRESKPKEVYEEEADKGIYVYYDPEPVK